MHKLITQWLDRLRELDELLARIDHTRRNYEMFKLTNAAGYLWSDYARQVHEFNCRKFWWMRRRWVRM